MRRSNGRSSLHAAGNVRPSPARACLRCGHAQELAVDTTPLGQELPPLTEAQLAKASIDRSQCAGSKICVTIAPLNIFDHPLLRACSWRRATCAWILMQPNARCTMPWRE